jgi:hypothetical protein
MPLPTDNATAQGPPQESPALVVAVAVAPAAAAAAAAPVAAAAASAAAAAAAPVAAAAASAAAAPVAAAAAPAAAAAAPVAAAAAGPAWKSFELQHAEWGITQRRAVAMAWRLELYGPARELSITDPMGLFDNHVAKCTAEQRQELVTPKQWKVSVPSELLLKPGKDKTTIVTLWWNGARWVDQSPAPRKRKRVDEKQVKAAASKAEENFALAAIRQDPLALKYAPEKLRDNEDVVLAAVREDVTGGALQYASDRLRDSEQVVLAAVKCPVDYGEYAAWRRCRSLEFASDRLRGCAEFVSAVCSDVGRLKSSVLRYASNGLRGNRAFVNTILNPHLQAVFGEPRTVEAMVAALRSRQAELRAEFRAELE